MVQVRQIAEMGAYVKLLEYDGTEGMILLSELSRRRIRSVQKLIRVGRNEVVVVLRVDKEKGYIDLSKRRVSPEDISKCEDKYMKSKTVASILRHVASKMDDAGIEGLGSPEALEIQDIEERKLHLLYEYIAWPLMATHGHSHEAFKLALASTEEADKVFGALSLPDPVKAVIPTLLSTIARRLTPQPVKVRADIEVTCYTELGIDAIRKALKKGEQESTETVPIKAKLVAPPLYVLNTNASDKHAAVDRLERAIESIQHEIEEMGGHLVVKMRPKAISETDEQDLAQLMAKADAENAEVSGDEDDEED